MMVRAAARVAVATATLAVVALTVLLGFNASVAAAHTMASSTVTVELTDDSMSGNLVLAVASLDQVFDPGQRSDELTATAYEEQVIAYLQDHLTVRGSDGTVWPETYSGYLRQTTEGIETIDVDLTVDTGDADPADFAIAYDAVIEALPDHEAVLVLVDADNQASTPGVFTASSPSIAVGDGSTSVALGDMARFGFHHVLDGSDHLLFLMTLLLPAPLIAIGGRWRRGPGLGWSLRKVIHVVTAFTIGHSLTLMATSLGWIAVPSAPVEVLIAVSVAVSAVHAIRPLVRGGEPAIAATFGLIHGMAFAGILADLGLSGRTSVLALLAFNVGIELAQLTATALVFPSLALMSSRRSYTALRIGGASIALVAAAAWITDRLGLGADPLTPVEDWVIAHRLVIPALLALGAVAVRLFDQRPLDGPQPLDRRRDGPGREPDENTVPSDCRPNPSRDPVPA